MESPFYKMPGFFFFFFKLGVFVGHVSERKVAPSSPTLCKVAFRTREVLLRKLAPGNGTQKAVLCRFLMPSGFRSSDRFIPCTDIFTKDGSVEKNICDCK